MATGADKYRDGKTPKQFQREREERLLEIRKAREERQKGVKIRRHRR